MTITLDGYNYGGVANLRHGTIVEPMFDSDVQAQSWWHVLGGAVFFGSLHTRVLTINVTFLNFATEADLRTHIATVQSHFGDNGTLVVDAVNWPQCGLLAYQPSGPAMRDGSGYHGWLQHGSLTFKQIAF